MTKILVQLLSLLFGFGSWIAITGLWLEIPVLINHSPERWSLASDMNFVIQLANVGLIIYYIFKVFKLTDETKASHILLAIGLLSCLLLIFGWNKTFYVWGTERSVVLFVATFGLSLVDCTSSVTFLPFMARFDSKYLTPYLIGEGLSGFLPTIFAVLQGVDPTDSCDQNIQNSSLNNNSISVETNIKTDLRFSAEIFFTSLLATLLISWLALTLLHTLPICKQESNFDYKIQETNDIIIVKSNTKYYYLLSLIFLCCFFTFGFMPSIQPYSSIPYGNGTLHYVVILSGLSYPFGCFLAMVFNRFNSIKLINFLTLFGHLIAVYIIICALMSPFPPLSQLSIGSFLMIFMWILFTTSLSFSKTLITVIISETNGNEGLFWVGFHTQLGGFLGATLSFLLIKYTNIFEETDCN